jgi:hypothetical protein
VLEEAHGGPVTVEPADPRPARENLPEGLFVNVVVPEIGRFHSDLPEQKYSRWRVRTASLA